MNKPELRRAIALPHATAMVVGTIIGASIFVQPSEITGQVPSVLGVSMVWLTAGVLTLFGALVCAELASIFSQSGGVYIYLKEAYSPSLGFLWGWAMFWTMHSGIIAAIAVVCIRYVAFFIPMGDVAARACAIGVIGLLSFVNYIGVRQGSLTQSLFTLGKVIAIVVMICLGFVLSPAAENPSVVAEPLPDFGMSHFATALIAGLFAFGGWHMVTYNAEETLSPQRTIPKALMLGTAIVTLCYVLLNAVYLHVLPLQQVISTNRIAADAADALMGSGGAVFMSALVVFSTIGALSGIILAGPRVYYAMARDGLLFGWLGEVHPKFRTPHKAILLQAVWSSVLVATGTYRVLFTRVIYTEWIFFGLMAIGLILLRRRQDLSRSYSVWGYPALPVVFAVSAFAIVVHQVYVDPSESLFGLMLVLIGLPAYHFWAKPGFNKE